MNMLDALSKAGSLWVRPVAWRGLGEALVVGDGHKFRVGQIICMPMATGGRPALMPDLADLCGEWEVVEPKVVNAERNWR